MSLELLAILATAAFQAVGIVILGVMLYRMSNKQFADNAALFLQGRRLEHALREMRESLADEFAKGKG